MQVERPKLACNTSMPESEREIGREATPESQSKVINTREELRDFAKSTRMQIEGNTFKADIMLMRTFAERVELMAEEFPELELTPFQKRLLWNALGGIDYMLFEDAKEETETGQEVTRHGDYAARSHRINLTLLQVYSFLHDLEGPHKEAA